MNGKPSIMSSRFHGCAGVWVWLAAAMLCSAGAATAADRWGPALSAWLPDGALFYHEDADPDLAAAGAATAIDRIANLPEMAPFHNDLERSRQAWIQEIAAAAKIPPAEVEAVVGARRSMALLDIIAGPGGKPSPVLAMQLRFAAPPDPQRLYDAIRAYANQPRFVEMAQRQGIPLTKICWQETWPEAGPNPVLMLAGTPPIRFVLSGQSLLVYYGPVEPLRKMLAVMTDPSSAPSLVRNPGFQAAWQGAGAGKGSSFLYLNAARATAALAAMGQERIVHFLEELGLDSVHSIGCSGAAAEDGWRHTVYLHTPGPRTGLLSALRPGLVGAEQYAGAAPSDARYSFSGRLNWRALWGEIPAFIQATRRMVEEPRALAVMEKITNTTQFGVSMDELLAAVGDDASVIDGPDGPVVRFDAARLQSVGQVLGKIEQAAGYAFQPLQVGRFDIRYLNRAKNTMMLAAPSLSVMGARQDNPGFGSLAAALYPQALTSFFGRKQPEPLSRTPEFIKAAAGVGPGQSIFLYFDNRAGMRRTYNALLPVVSLFGYLSPAGTPNPALLPPGSVLEPYLTPCALGVKADAAGITVTAHSAVGLGGVIASVLDCFVINNPALIGILLNTHPEDWFGPEGGAGRP